MISFGVKDNFDAVAKSFDQTMAKQVPFATSLALNNVAKIAQQRLIYTMQNVFNNPVPYTLNSTYIRFSNKTNLTAEVGHKDFAGKGTPASKYLRPEIEGGIRIGQKRSEKILAAKAGVPNGVWVPARGVANSYGNVSGALITKILSTVGGLSEVGFAGNQTARSRKRLGARAKQYFIMRVNNPRGLKPGVYERIGSSIRPILFIVPSAKYAVRYEFNKIVEDTIRDRMDGEFTKAMDYAMATAKVKIPVT